MTVDRDSDSGGKRAWQWGWGRVGVLSYALRVQLGEFARGKGGGGVEVSRATV